MMLPTMRAVSRIAPLDTNVLVAQIERDDIHQQLARRWSPTAA